MAEQVYIATEADRQELMRMRQRIDSILGGERTARRAEDDQGLRLWTWIKIDGSAALGGGTSNRWKYGWDEVEATADGWQVMTGGRSGTTTTDYALNALEYSETLITSALPDGTIAKLFVVLNEDYTVGRWIVAGGGGGLPAPGLQYQVLQLQGDPLTPTWDYVRLVNV